ncbi:MAG: DNA topoisomerase VI subunit B [Candidatus Heimdallarchaeota archaeon]
MTTEEVVRRSAADFFHDNKAIAGFDNPMRAVFTSVRELVENGLDAAEKRGVPPRISCSIERLQLDEVASLLGIEKVEEAPGSAEYLCLTVRDNGTGVPHRYIPMLFGRVLTGSNYGARQTRGRFGLGAKMVLLNAMATVDLPIQIKSRYSGPLGVEENTSYYELIIDLQKNEPIIREEEEFPPLDTRAMDDAGTEITVSFTGNIRAARRYLEEYFHQLSIITPHATFDLKLPGEDLRTHESITDDMPAYPETTKVHPYGTDITQLKREIAVTTSANMIEFLQEHFQGVDRRGVGEDFLREVGISLETNPKELKSSDIRRIVHEGFQRAQIEAQTVKKKSERRFRFGDPKGDALSPLGARRLELGLEKELTPEFVWGTQRKPSAYSGHSFIIEAAVAYGGKRHQEEQESETSKRRKKWIVYRFANRIPLLFGEGNDVITRGLSDIDWSKDYKISENLPLAFAISLVSTKIPFPETSKEYIANVHEIRNEIVRALRACGRELRTFHSRRARERREQSRRSKFEASAPKVVSKLFEIIESHHSAFPYDITEAQKRMSAALATGVPKKVRRLVPPSEPLYTAKVWIDPRLEKEMISKGIKTVNDFLMTSDYILARSKGLSRARTREIKRKTVTQLDHNPRTRRIGHIGLISSQADNIDPNFLPYESALSRKWITTAYDFLATSTKDLLSIEGLSQKLIQQEKINIARSYAHISPQISEIEWLSELAKGFKRKEIVTAYDFLAAPSLELRKVKGLSSALISQMKAPIRNNQMESSLKIESDSFPWMKYSIRMDLASKNIISIEDLLATGSSELEEIDSMILALLEHERSLLKDHLNKDESVPRIRELDWIDVKDVSAIERSGIRTIPDFLNESLSRLASLGSNSVSKTLINVAQERIHKKQNLDPSTLPISQMYWMADELENEFTKMGIRTIFDALRLTLSDVTGIEGVKEQLKRLKQSYGTPLDSLGEYGDLLHNKGIICLEDLYDDPQQKLLELSLDKQTVETITQFLEAPAFFLADFPHLKSREFHRIGVSRVIDFLVWDSAKLEELADFEHLQRIKESATPEIVLANIENISFPIGSLAGIDPKLVETLEASGGSSVQEYYFKQVEIPRKLNKKAEAVKTLLNSPIVLIEGIEPVKIEKMLEIGIILVVDLLFSPNALLETELGLSEQEIIALKDSCSRLRKGTPLKQFRPEKDRSWTRGELAALRSARIETVEGLYFRTEKATFDASSIPWKTLDRLKRRLEAPIAMIEIFASESTKNESKAEEATELTPGDEADASKSTEQVMGKNDVKGYARPLSGALIDKLAEIGVSTVLQFVWWPFENLLDKIQLTDEEAGKFDAEFTVRETGIPLDVLGLERRLTRRLEELGADKVEELYFSLTPEECQEENIPWAPIEEVRNLLDAPLALFDRLQPEELSMLRERGISTILRFLLGSSTDLAQTIKASEERINELRHLLDFKALRESFYSPVTLLRDLPITSFEKLAEEGINSIGDFWLSPGKDLTELTGLSLADIAGIKESIGAKKVARFREEEAALADLFGLSRGMARKFQRAELAKVSDIFLLTDEAVDSFSADSELLTAVKKIKIALDSPVSFIDNIPRDFLPLLLNAGISTVGRFLISQPGDVSEILALDMTILEDIRENISLQTTTELLELPYRVLPEFTQSPVLLKKLETAGFESVADLIAVLSKSQTIPEEVKILTLDILSGIDPLTVIQGLSVPLSVIDSLPDEILASLRKKRISDLYQLVRNPELLFTLPSSSTDIEEGIQQDPSQTEEEFLLLDLIDFQDLHETMGLPISYAPGFTPEELATLARVGNVFSIKQLIQTSEDELASLLDISARDAKNRLQSLTIGRIKARVQEIGVPLFLLKIFDTDVLQRASVGGYSWFGDLYLVEKRKIADFFPKGKLRAFYDAADTALAYVDSITPSVLEILRREGYPRIRDFLLLSDAELERIFQDSWSEAKHQRAAINFDNVNVQRTSDRPLAAPIIALETPEEEDSAEWKKCFERLLAELEDRNIKFLIELGYLGREVEHLISEDLRPLLQRIIHLIESPIFFLPKIDSSTAKSLASNGIRTILDILYWDPKKLAENCGISRAFLTEILDTIKLADIAQKREKNQVTIEKVNAFTTNAQADLEELGFPALLDVVMRLNSESVRSTTWKAVETVKAFLNSPVSFHSQLVEKFPGKLVHLIDEGVLSLQDLLSWSPKDLAKALNCDEEDAKALQLSTDINQLRRRKKGLGIRIEKIRGFSKQLLKLLQENEIETVDHVLFGDLGEVIKYNPRLQREARTFVETLKKSPDHIKGIGWAKKELLQQNGICSVFDFLIRSDKELTGLLGISLSQLREIRNEPELVTLLDREKLTKLFPLSTTEKKYLSRSRLRSFYDLYPTGKKSPSEELTLDEKSRFLVETLESVLRCPVSFLDDIQPEFIPRLADANIVQIKDFLFLIDDFSSLEEALGNDTGMIEHIRRYPSLKKAFNCIDLSISAFPGLSGFQSSFKESGIATLRDLVDSIETSDSSSDVIIKLLEEAPSDLMRNMDIPLTLSGVIPPEIAGALKKRKISNLYQLACLSPHVKQEIEIEIQKNHPTIAFPEINFARVTRALNRPICFVPGFLPTDYRKLANAGFRSIKSLFMKDPKTIARLISRKAEIVQKALDKATIENIEFLEHNIGTPLEILSLFTDNELQILSKHSINLFEELYFSQIDNLDAIIPKESLKRFYRIAEAPTLYIAEISPQNLPIIREYIPRIVDFLLLPDPLLTALLGEDWIRMKKKRFKPDFAEFETRRSAYPSLKHQTLLDGNLSGKLGDLNVDNLMDLAFLGEEIAPKLVTNDRKVIRRLQGLLDSDIAFMENLTEEKTSKLATAGINTVLKWLYWDSAQLSKIIDLKLPNIDDLRKQFQIEEIKEAIKRKRTSKRRRRPAKTKKSKTGKKPKRQKSLNAF